MISLSGSGESKNALQRLLSLARRTGLHDQPAQGLAASAAPKA
jgi:hypothetical protein